MMPPIHTPSPRRGIPPFSVLLIMIAVSVIGFAMLPRLKVQYSPSAPQHNIGVSFSWSGASARIMEQQVTSRIEGALSVISGCRNVSSYSSNGYGSVTVYFNKDTDMKAARFEAASILRALYDKLPEGVSYPSLSLAAEGRREQTALSYTIKAGIPSEQIYDYILDNVSVPLSRVDGVGRVNISGATPFEWVVTFDPEALESAGLTASALASAFTDYFRSDIIGMTTLENDEGEQRNIVLKLRNLSSTDFDDIPITKRNGRIYYLRDFATVRWREALPSSYYRINGLNTITLSVTCETGSNILRVSEAVREEMSRLQASFPPQITASLSYDASRYISDELDKIYSRTLWCLAILLVFVFLVSRDVRYLVMITVTLAVNLLVAVVFYNLLDVGIHIYSLAGITVSLGIMIDTAIIMVDHYSYYHNRRVFTSILGALLTTIGALGIVWLLPEDQQANLTDFSLVIIINLTVSMIVALLFVPSMIDKFPLGRSMTTLPRRSRRRIARISRRYERFIAWGRRHRWAFLVLLVWGFGIPTFLLPERLSDPQDENPPLHRRLYDKVMTSRFVTENRLTLDMIFGTSVNLFNKKTSAYSYYRSPEQKRLMINAGMPEGCTVQQLNDVVRHMENYISQYDEIASFHTSVNSYDNATIEVTFRREYENTSFPSRLKQEIISAAANFGGATWRVSGVDDQYFNNNVVTSYRSNSIRLRGYNYDQLSEFADRLLDSLRQNRRVSEPEIMDGNSWSLPSNEFHIRYNDEQIAAAGLNIYDYYSALSTKLYNSGLATIYNGHELQRVVMESGGRDRFDKWNLENALVTETDTPMKLSTVGSIEKRRTGMAIRRSRQSYEISVGFDFIGSYELCNRLVDKTIKQFNEEILPLGFRADAPSYGGWNDSKKTQIKLILLVIAIIYTMCAIIFESLLKPLVIIMMIPISFIGVFLTFGLFDFRFDQGGFAAFVLLCGIVVNAGIYLITEYDECRRTSSKQGLQLYMMAFNHKIVPISLTILSTILGLVPFLYDGPEEVFWFAFAMAAISGTAFSILALIIYLPIFMPLGERKSTGSVHDYGTRNVCSDVGPNRSA